jgi:hypothetical protein
MITLFELCLHAILKLNSYYYDKLSVDVLEKLKRLQIQQECSDIAFQIIRTEKERVESWAGYEKGIMLVLQNKDYVQNNIRAYEKEYKKQFYQWTFLKKPYILYYLEQEPEYKEKYPQRGSVKYYDYMTEEEFKKAKYII